MDVHCGIHAIRHRDELHRSSFRNGWRVCAMVHVLAEQFDEPGVKSRRRGGIVRETGAIPCTFADRGLGKQDERRKNQEKERVLAPRGSELRFPSRMKSIRQALQELRGIARRMPLEREPREEPRVTLSLERREHPREKLGCVVCFEGLRRECGERVALYGLEGALDDGVDERFAAAEVMEDRRVRDAHVLGELLEANAGGADLSKPLFRGVEDERARFFGRSAHTLLPRGLLLRLFRRHRLEIPQGFVSIDNFVGHLLTGL